jgi:hypothetical protein
VRVTGIGSDYILKLGPKSKKPVKNGVGTTETQQPRDGCLDLGNARIVLVEGCETWVDESVFEMERWVKTGSNALTKVLTKKGMN